MLRWSMEDKMIAVKDIMVATDFDPASEAALAYGRTLARAFGATLHLFHASENFFLRPSAIDPAALKASTQRRLEERLTDVERRNRSACAALVTSDQPADAIIEYAKSAQIDLIVMGTHGRTGISHVLMGSVAEHVVRSAPCPVLTVRHPERTFLVSDEAPATRETRPS